MTKRLEENNKSHNDTLAEDEFYRNEKPIFEGNDSLFYDKDVYIAEYLEEYNA